jgi:hypothetical protein
MFSFGHLISKLTDFLHRNKANAIAAFQAPATQLPVPPLQDLRAWKIIEDFAVDEMTLPEVIGRLESYLGNAYSYGDWKLAIDAVLGAENDSQVAKAAIETLRTQNLQPVSVSPLSASAPELPAQSILLESELMESVQELQKRRRIIGSAPTLDDLLNPISEQEIGQSLFSFEGGDSEIVEEVERSLAIERGEISEIEEDSDSDDEEEAPDVSLRETAELCEALERLCLAHTAIGSVDGLELSQMLRRFRAQLSKADMASCTQAPLEHFWSSKADKP